MPRSACRRPPPSTRSSAIVFIVASRKRVTRLRNIGRNTWPRIKPSGRKIDARKIRAALECELVAGTFSEPAAFFFSFFRISIFDLLPLHCRCRRNRGRLPNPSIPPLSLLPRENNIHVLARRGDNFYWHVLTFPSVGWCVPVLTEPGPIIARRRGGVFMPDRIGFPDCSDLTATRECFEKRATASYEIVTKRSARLAGGGYYYYGFGKNGKAKFVTSSILLLGISPFFPIFFPSPTCEF